MERSRGVGESGGRGEMELRGSRRARAREVRAPLPARLRPRLSGPPAATLHSAPRRLGGNTLPWGLSEPASLGCQHVPRTLASTPTLSRHHHLPLPPAKPETLACRVPSPRLGSSEPASPMPESLLSGSPDIASHSHPARTARTGNLGTKRRQP